MIIDFFTISAVVVASAVIAAVITLAVSKKRNNQ